jgi:hypothetical protein
MMIRFAGPHSDSGHKVFGNDIPDVLRKLQVQTAIAEPHPGHQDWEVICNQVVYHTDEIAEYEVGQSVLMVSLLVPPVAFLSSATPLT